MRQNGSKKKPKSSKESKVSRYPSSPPSVCFKYGSVHRCLSQETDRLLDGEEPEVRIAK